MLSWASQLAWASPKDSLVSGLSHESGQWEALTKDQRKKSEDFYTLTFSLFQMALVSCSPLLKATAPVSPSSHDSSSLVALSFCPGDSPIGSTGSLQLIAPPSYTEPFPLNSAHTSIIILFSKLFSYPNWIQNILCGRT